MAKTIHVHLHDYAGQGMRTRQALRKVTKDITPRRYWTLRVVWKNGEVDNYNFETEGEARAAKRARLQVEAIEKLVLKRPDGMVMDACGCAKCQAAKDAQQAYKGYLIKTGLRPDEYYISKDGQHIGTASTLQAAKQIIDQLVD